MEFSGRINLVSIFRSLLSYLEAGAAQLFMRRWLCNRVKRPTPPNLWKSKRLPRERRTFQSHMLQYSAEVGVHCLRYSFHSLRMVASTAKPAPSTSLEVRAFLFCLSIGPIAIRIPWKAALAGSCIWIEPQSVCCLSEFPHKEGKQNA
jgi:hypothetical protein